MKTAIIVAMLTISAGAQTTLFIDTRLPNQNPMVRELKQKLEDAHVATVVPLAEKAEVILLLDQTARNLGNCASIWLQGSCGHRGRAVLRVRATGEELWTEERGGGWEMAGWSDAKVGKKLGVHLLAFFKGWEKTFGFPLPNGPKQNPIQFSVLQAKIDGHPMIAMIATGLRTSSNMQLLPIYLSVSTPLAGPTSDGLPTTGDAHDLNGWEEIIESKLGSAGNLGFLGRVTWNGHRELMYYVGNEQPALQALNALLEAHSTRPFTLSHERDEKWRREKSWTSLGEAPDPQLVRSMR